MSAADPRVEQAVRKGYVDADPKVLAAWPVDELKAYLLQVFGPCGFNVPNPDGVASALILVIRSQRRNSWNTKTNEYVQSLVDSHLSRLSMKSCAFEVIVDATERNRYVIDQAWLRAMQETDNMLKNRLDVLKYTTPPPVFEEWAMTFNREPHDPVTNSAYFIASRLGWVSVPPNEVQTMAINGIRQAALAPVSQNEYTQEDVYFPLLGIINYALLPLGIAEGFLGLGKRFILFDFCRFRSQTYTL